ncbi:MAG: outer membrane protein assembly factor BamB [Kiritimatiellia bacterium]|jgi:outer membrane protein assembly factor BamB
MQHLKTLSLLVGLGLSSSLFGDDWPQWRGPDRTDIGKETGILQSWPKDGPKQLWTYHHAGVGYAGPAIVDGKLYTMGSIEKTEKLICLDANSGKELWTLAIGEELENDWGNGPRGTPTVDGDRLYTLSAKGHLHCVDLTTGKSVWTKSLVSDLGGGVPGWGYTESPLVDGDQVIVTPGGSKGAIAALNKSTGELIWQSKDFKDPAQYSSCIVAEHNGKRQYIQLVTANVVGIDASNGNVLWKTPWDGRTAVIPTPIFKEGQVFVSTGYGVGSMVVNIASDWTVTQVWKNKNMKNHHGGVILKDNHLFGYSDGAGWCCIDWPTGEFAWREKGSLDKGAIGYTDGRFYLLEEKSGTVVLIEASTKGYKEEGRFVLAPQTELRKPKGRVWTHPVISNGKLYLRDQEIIHCYDVKK